jgi:hypothetical protein
MLEGTERLSANRQIREEGCLTSDLFKRMYSQTLMVLEVSAEVVKGDGFLQDFYNQILLLLRFYLQLHPKILFTDNRLLLILKTLDAGTSEGFLVIKTIYQLFTALLPSSNLELLNFIRDNFSKRFHFMVRNDLLREDG